MSPTRLIRTPKQRGLRAGTDVVCTTTYSADPSAKFDYREHVTLETPKTVTDTQRLRLVQSWETDKKWRTS
jgi:hypothetical protein